MMIYDAIHTIIQTYDHLQNRLGQWKSILTRVINYIFLIDLCERFSERTHTKNERMPQRMSARREEWAHAQIKGILGI